MIRSVAGAAACTSIGVALCAVAPAVAQEATAYGIVATVEDVGQAPTGVAINPSTQAVYVANPVGPDRVGSLAIVDGTTNALRRVLFTAAEMPNPTSVGVDSTTGRVFVANPQAVPINQLTLIEDDAITGALGVGRMASWVTVDETDTPRKVYVTNYGDASRDVSGISIIHTTDAGSRLHATTAFSPSRGVTAVAVDTERSPHRAWAVNSNSGTHPLAGSLTTVESLVDKATFTNWSGVLPADTTPAFAAVSPGTHTLYLADRVTDEVHRVDTSAAVPTPGKPLHTARRAGHAPVAMAYDAILDRLFVLYANETKPAADGELAVLDASTGDVLQHLPLASPGGMALDTTTGALWVTDTAHGKVHMVAEESAGNSDRLRSRPSLGAPLETAPEGGPSKTPRGDGSTSPTPREQPAWNSQGEPCGAVTTRPRC